MRLLKPFQESVTKLVCILLLQYSCLLLCGYDNENVKINDRKDGKAFVNISQRKVP